MVLCMSPTVVQQLRGYIEDLRERAEETGGPSEISEAFTDADDYPEFDEDAGANYLTGLIAGIAEALGVSPLDLVAQYGDDAAAETDHIVRRRTRC